MSVNLFPLLTFFTRVLEVLKEVMWSGPSTWLMLEEKVYSLSYEENSFPHCFWPPDPLSSPRSVWVGFPFPD